MNSRTIPSIRPDNVPADLLDRLQDRLRYGLPQTLGIELTMLEYGQLRLLMRITERHLAVNGYLHAGSVVSLADTACGFGCIAHLPDGAVNFTTVELKSNFLGTAMDGIVEAEAQLRHAGRSTQIWDATVRSEKGKTIALFRCTQMILYPKE
ncbi:MAG: PaaI family thioesterase [Caldilineaceae bacterium]|nr:PaaI family thioesterase [Caldilineaceae bacterium]